MDHHKTRIPFVYGYIDVNNNTTIRGWLINIRTRSSVNANLFRAIQEKGQEELPFRYGAPRPDVKDVYQLVSGDCEYSISRTDPSSPVLIQMFMFNEWKTVVEVPKSQDRLPQQMPAKQEFILPTTKVSNEETLTSNSAMHRDVIVIDEFYENPDVVRQMALRGDTRISLDDFKVFLEHIVGGKIVSMEQPKFESNIAENIWYVTGDTKPNTYYANVFLTPNAPITTGITLYASIDTGKRTYIPEFHGNISYDMTRFNPIDKVGNVYNRLVVWNANLLHGPSCFFGSTKENGRLVLAVKFTTVYPYS